MASGRSHALERVARGDLCSGCGLCAALGGDAIEMVASPTGFNRPVARGPVSREVDEAIADTCPGLVLPAWDKRVEQHPYWGPYRSVLTGHAEDAALRHHASSGGLLSALLIHALDTGLIDAVLHIDADPEHPARNTIIISRDRQAIIDAAGSRYAPSSPLAVIEEVLASKEKWAVVGKPCDISALRRLATRDPRVDARIPLMLSFFCGGVPSHGGTGKILDALGVAPDDLASFRYRGDGWPGFATATRRDGSQERMSYMDSWGRHLSPTVQYRCKICPDAVGGAADVACGDAWHGDENGYPLFEELEGRSLAMARTKAGAALIENAATARAITVEPLAVAAIDQMQPGQVRRKRAVLARLLGAALLGEGSFHPRGVGILAAARRAPPREFLRNLAGTFRRVLGRRLRARS